MVKLHPIALATDSSQSVSKDPWRKAWWIRCRDCPMPSARLWMVIPFRFSISRIFSSMLNSFIVSHPFVASSYHTRLTIHNKKFTDERKKLIKVIDKRKQQVYNMYCQKHYRSRKARKEGKRNDQTTEKYHRHRHGETRRPL